MIRPPTVAGLFYPADPKTLRHEVVAFLSAAQTRSLVPKALIVPHAGYIYSGPVAASAYKLLEPLLGRIERVVLFGPSHHVGFRGLALTTHDAYATPLGNIAIDKAACDILRSLPDVIDLDRAHAKEHSLEVHLPFLQMTFGEFKLVPVVVGDAEPTTVACALETIWGGPETLIVVSSDLSHYLDYDAAKIFDSATTSSIEKLDWQGLDHDGACGFYPIRGLLSVAKKKALQVTTLDVRNSGDTAGSRDRVVGYGAWAFES